MKLVTSNIIFRKVSGWEIPAIRILWFWGGEIFEPCLQQTMIPMGIQPTAETTPATIPRMREELAWLNPMIYIWIIWTEIVWLRDTLSWPLITLSFNICEHYIIPKHTMSWDTISLDCFWMFNGFSRTFPGIFPWIKWLNWGPAGA